MSEEIKCPLCQSEAVLLPITRDGQDIDCPKCGSYFISGTMLSCLEYDDVKPNLLTISSWITNQNKIEHVKRPEITTLNIREIINK